MDLIEPTASPDPGALSGGVPVPDATAPALERVVRLAAWAFGAPFAQLVRFGPGRPVSHCALGGGAPDLRALGARLPAGAALVVVEDASRDVRFEGVLPAGTRFFAWAAAEADGQALGALAVLDVEPHPPIPTDRLLDLAAVAADLLRGGDALTRFADAEARCAEAAVRFEALGDLVSDAVVVADPDGLVLDVNDHAIELLGGNPSERYLGRPLDSLLHSGDGAPRVLAVERPFPYEGQALRLAVLRQEEAGR